jgi:hypothetical protein
MSEYKLPCPVCGKIREFATKEYFYKARKHNKACKSCSNSIKLGGPGNLYREGNFKICTSCNTKKSLDDFFKYPSNHYHSCCKECSKEKSQRYHKNTYRYAKYGINKEDFDKMIIDQNNSCKICNQQLNDEIHIDHCHSTGKVRGLLCGKCNKGLGQFNDDIEILTNAIKYLKNE